MEDQTFKNYLHDLGTLVKEYAREAKEQKYSSKGSSSQDYESGYLMAWYEVVSLMQQQAEAFGIPFESLDLHDIDPNKDLFILPSVKPLSSDMGDVTSKISMRHVTPGKID